MCLTNPDLDVFDISISELNKELGATNKSLDRELICFNILIAIWERTFLLYESHSTKSAKQQWLGWEEYIKDYCTSVSLRLFT